MELASVYSECPRVLVCITVGVGFLLYYLLEAVKHPLLASRRKSGWRRFLEENLSILQERYWPTPWCYESRCQTVLASILRCRLPKIPYTREVLHLRDGGQISLDWLGNDQKESLVPEVSSCIQASDSPKSQNSGSDPQVDPTDDAKGPTIGPNNPEPSGVHSSSKLDDSSCSTDGPTTGNGTGSSGGPRDLEGMIVLILPGLTGSSQSEYVKGLVLTLTSLTSATCVVLNNRGTGGIKLMTTRTYCAANSDDLEEALQYLSHTHPRADIVAVGISLGGMITGNYLTSRGEDAARYLMAAVVVSIPWNMVVGVSSMERPFCNLLLNHYLARCLCQLATSLSYKLAGNHKWDLDHVVKSNTIREFDTRFTAMQFGFRDAEDYYESSCLHEKLHQIRVPLLCLTAADDPFQPLHAIPLEAAERSSHVAMVVTARGGHIGFMEGLLPPANTPYYSDRLIAQLVTALCKQTHNLAEVKREADLFAQRQDYEDSEDLKHLINNGTSVSK